MKKTKQLQIYLIFYETQHFCKVYELLLTLELEAVHFEHCLEASDGGVRGTGPFQTWRSRAENK